MLFAGIFFLAIGIPFFLISAKTISKVYGQANIYTSGVYSVCRHPLYSSFIFFIVPGIVLLFESWILLTIPFIMYLTFRILIIEEEKYLKSEFGVQYLNYKKEVNLVCPKLWKFKIKSQTVILLALFIVAFTFTACKNQTDNTYEFFKNSELQYETPTQERYILEALNDIRNLKLSEDELKQKRYEDYMGKGFQWNLLELINHHFVPSDQNITLQNNFYTQIKRKEVQEEIERIIAEIQKNIQDYEIIVGNNIKFDLGNDGIGKEEKLVIFTLVVTNLSDTIPVPVLSNENVYQHATFFINNKEVTNPATMGGLERTREKDVLLKDEGDYFSWGTSVEYLKTEYGNSFTVRWKYLNIYSNISKINLEDGTIK